MVVTIKEDIISPETSEVLVPRGSVVGLELLRRLVEYYGFDYFITSEGVLHI